MLAPVPAGTFVLQADVELGSGGYGKVVQATEKSTGRMCAGKVISTSRMKASAIHKEINLMAKLKHENIIELLGYEDIPEKKRMIIFMELAANGDLFSRVISSGTLEEDQAKPYFMQLMSAVQHMHTVGCVHRDLKLENVLLDAGDSCKVCDFGLAHVYEVSNKEIQLTKLREICGSKSYCAPEVLEGRGYDGFPTDVWSCGICLFAMLAGFFPLDEASGSDWRYERVKMAAQQQCSVTHTIFGFYERPCTLSGEVTDLIDSMLVIDPARRLEVAHSLQSSWLSGKKGMEVDSYQPVYRAVAGVTAEDLERMYAEEAPRPVYRGGGPAPSGPPMLAKQAQIFCADFHEEPL